MINLKTFSIGVSVSIPCLYRQIVEGSSKSSYIIVCYLNVIITNFPSMGQKIYHNPIKLFSEPTLCYSEPGVDVNGTVFTNFTCPLPDLDRKLTRCCNNTCCMPQVVPKHDKSDNSVYGSNFIFFMIVHFMNAKFLVKV